MTEQQSKYIVQRFDVDDRLWNDAGRSIAGPRDAKRQLAEARSPGKYRVLKVVDEFEVIETPQPVYEIK